MKETVNFPRPLRGGLAKNTASMTSTRVRSSARAAAAAQARRGGDAGAHARHAHITKIVIVDVPSTLDQPPELLWIVLSCGPPHGIVVIIMRVAHRVRRAVGPRPLGNLRIRGDARGSAVTLERRPAITVPVRMQLAHTPLGARVAAAAVARGRVEDARSDHGAQSRLPQRLAPEAPSSVVWACEAAVAPKAPKVCDAGHRARRGHRARE